MWDWILKNISTLIIAVSTLLPALLAALFAWQSSATAKKALKRSQNLEVYRLAHQVFIEAHDLIYACNLLEVEISYWEERYESASTDDTIATNMKSLLDVSRKFLNSRSLAQQTIGIYEESMLDTDDPDAKLKSLVGVHSALYGSTLAARLAQEQLRFATDKMEISRNEVKGVEAELRDKKFSLALAKMQAATKLATELL